MKRAGIIMVCLTLVLIACKHAAKNDKLILGKWQYTTYAWKYFDKEMATLNVHLAAATDSATHTVYSDSVKLLTGIEDDSKRITMEFLKDGSFIIAYQPVEGKAEGGKGTWKLLENKKLLIVPYYPQDDTLLLESVNKDSLVITGIDRGEPFKIVCGKAK